MMRAVTEFLAEFAASDLRLTEEARTAARRTIVSALSLAVGASRHPAVEIALEVVRSYYTLPQASILGRMERCASTWAALLNGIAAFIEDFDDTHLPTIMHAGAAIVPTALAAAELSEASGVELLEGVAVGVEIAFRIANGMSPEIHERGWHVSGTVGHLAAAATAGRILKLDVPQLRAALGIASAQAAGLGAAPGSYTRGLHLGKAAADGIEAAVLARDGFTAAPDAIEGRYGFGEPYAPRFDPNQILDGLGERWELEAEHVQAVRVRDHQSSGNRCRDRAAPSRSRDRRGSRDRGRRESGGPPGARHAPSSSRHAQ